MQGIGAKKEGVVVSVMPGSSPKRPLMTVVEMADRSREQMLGVEHAVEPRQGARVEIELVRGGPLGAYWKIVGAAAVAV